MNVEFGHRIAKPTEPEPYMIGRRRREEASIFLTAVLTNTASHTALKALKDLLDRDEFACVARVADEHVFSTTTNNKKQEKLKPGDPRLGSVMPVMNLDVGKKGHDSSNKGR